MAALSAQTTPDLAKTKGSFRQVYYTDHHTLDLPQQHKFPADKYRILRQVLESQQLFHFVPAPPVDAATLALAHDPGYIEQFMAGTLPAASMRRIGLPWSESFVRRAMASVGGTLSASRDALAYGRGATLGGGTHHAFRAEGSGFCVFNDIAVSIEKLRQEGRIERAAVIDLDVHQGDGTAEIFRDAAHVFTFSMHGQSNFPFRKQKSSLDIALPDKTGDTEYLHHLENALPQVFAFAPDIIFYQSGVDPLDCDVLGRLALTLEGLTVRDRKVMLTVRDSGIPFVLTSGGGYARPIERSVEAHTNTYRTAAEIFLA